LLANETLPPYPNLQYYESSHKVKELILFVIKKIFNVWKSYKEAYRRGSSGHRM